MMISHDPRKIKIRGQGMLEYILIIALIFLSAYLSLELTGYNLRDAYCKAADILGNPEACATEKIYCEDDFLSAENWVSQYGNWYNEDGQLCTSRGAKNYNQCSLNMDNASDYTIKLTDTTLNQGNGYGLFFRGTEMDGRTDGYIVQYDPGWGGGAIIMRKWINGRELPPFATYRMSEYDWYGEPHDMQLNVEGDTFTFILDGEVVLVGQDDTYSEGGVGFRSWDSSEVCFGNMVISELAKESDGE